MATDEDGIGRGKPPKAYQFKKGRSGHPAGRPPRPRKAIWQLINHYLMQKCEVTENGKVRKLARYALILRRIESQMMKKPSKRLQRIEAKYEAFARAMPIRRKPRKKGK
ncbi:MAG: hypothetical protein J0I19_08165 [Alphaproteobacteria bacterium]|nr:hypothetical protein [Alphaproteobacteria bacterium]